MVVTDKQFKGYVHGWSMSNSQFLCNHNQILAWCKELCGCRRGIWWDYSFDNNDFATIVWFSREEDLMAFILRWS